MTSAIRRVARAAGRAARSAAGGLSKWREELHPRDRLGRFRDKWKLSPKASAQLNRVLNAFNPRAVDDMFDSNDDAQNYARGIHAKQRGRWTPAQSATLDKFFKVDKDGVLGRDDVDAVVNDNRSSPDVENLDNMMQPLPEDVVLTQVVGAEAFGLPPERIAEVEEWTGKLAMSKSYSPTNMGLPNSTVTGPHVTMSFLTPKGTKAAVDKTGNVLLDRETPFRITHVDPDGKGGQTVYAVIMPKQGNKEPARALGKALPEREKAPAVDATPEEFERRGLDPETGEPIEQAVPPAPKAAPAKAQGTARQIKKAGGEVPAGAGRVTREGDTAPEAEEPPSRDVTRAAEAGRAERATRARRALEERQRQEGVAGTVRERIQQEHQAVVRATPVAKGLSDVHEAVGRGGNDQSIADRLRAQASSDEILRIDDDDEQSRIVEELEQAAQEMENGDRPAALRRLDRLARTQNIERIHEPQEEVDFDDVSMEFIGDGPRPAAGDRVRVTRPGSRFIRRRDGNVIPIERPQVTRLDAPGAPAAPAQTTGLPSSRGGTDIRGLTEEQKRAVVARVRLLSREPGFPRNDEQRRLQRLADDIMAERAGVGRRRQAAEEAIEEGAEAVEAPEAPEAPTPAKATRAARRAAGEAPVKRVPRAPSKRLPRAERQALAKSTPAQIRRAAARRGVTDLQGETPAELVDDLMRRLAAEDRGGDVVKKALPKKAGRKAAKAAKALPEPGSREELEALGVGPDDLQTDVPNLRLVRDARTLGDINILAKDMGVRIPSSIGRREDRREFLRRAVAILPGESEEDYNTRIAEMRGAPAKRAVAKAEAATRKAAKKAGAAAPERVRAGTPEADALEATAFRERGARRYQPQPGEVKYARLIEKSDDEETSITPEWGGEQKFKGSYMEIYDPETNEVKYGSDLDRWNADNIRAPGGEEDGWVKNVPVDAYQHRGAPRRIVTDIEDKEVQETQNVANDGDWIVRQRGGEVQVITDEEFRKRYQADSGQPLKAARAPARKTPAAPVKKAAKAVPEPTKATAAKALRVTRNDPLRDGDRVEWTPSPESGEEPLQGTVVKVPSQTGRTERTFIDWDSGMRESTGSTRPGAGVRRIARAPEAPEPAKAAKKVAKKAAKAAPESPTKQVAKKAAKVAAPQEPAKKAAKATPRLTPNQRFMMDRVETRSRSRRGVANDGWVDADVVGSKATLENLHGKGLLERREERGPRGGLKRFYRPVPAEQRSRGITERVAPPVGAPVAKRLAKKAAPEKATKKAAAAKKAQDARIRAATRERVAADVAETRRQQKIAAKAPGAKKAAKKAAPEVRLTANQESLRDRVAELSPQGDDGWVNAADIGSPATLRTLAAKGVLEEMETPGARGRGVQRWYRPAGMPGAKKVAPSAVKKAAPKAAKKAAPKISGTRLAPTGPPATTPTARRVAKQLQDGEITPDEAAAALTRPAKRAPTKALPTKQEIGAWRTRDEAQEAIADLKNDQLRALLDREGVTYGSRDNKTQLRDRVAQSLVGQRAISEALSRSAEESQAKRTATQALKKAAPRAALAREIRPGDRIMVNRTPDGIRPATRAGEGEPFEVSDVQDYPSPRGGAMGRVLITGRDQNGDIAEVNFDRAGGLRPSQMLRRAPDSVVDIPSVAQGAKKAAPEAPDLERGAPTEGRSISQLRQIAAAEGIPLPRTGSRDELAATIRDFRFNRDEGFVSTLIPPGDSENRAAVAKAVRKAIRTGDLDPNRTGRLSDADVEALAPTEAPFLRERRNRLREQFDEILRDGANVPGFDDRPSDGFASPREVVQQWIDGLEQAPPDMQISRGSLREAARRFQRLDNVRISNLFNRAEQRLSESQGERPDLSNVPKDTQQRFGRLGPGAQARAERAMAALHQDDVQMRGDLGRPLARAKKDLLAGTHPNDVKRDLRIASRFLRERNEGNDSAAADRYDRMVDGISPSGRMERDLATAPALPKPEATGQPDYWYDEAVRERLFPGILVASDPENDIRRGLVVRLGDADEDETGRAPKWGWIRKVDDNGDVIIDVPDGERRIVERDVVEDWIRNYAPEGRVLQGGSELIPAQRAVRDVQGILDNITGNRSLTAEERNRIVDAMSGLTRGHNGDDLELVQVTRNLRNNPSRPEDVDRALAAMGRRLGVDIPRRQNRAFAPPPPEKRTTREVLENARREAAKRVAARQAPAASTATPEGPPRSTDPQDNVRKVAALLGGESPSIVPLYRIGRDGQTTDVGAITRRNRGDHDFTVIKPTDGSSPGWITRDTTQPNRWRVIERTDSGGERLIGFAPSPEIGTDVLANGEDRARRGKIVGDFRRALTTAPDGRTVEVEPRRVGKAVTPTRAAPEPTGPDLPVSELPPELRGPVPTTRDVLSMAATKRWAAANGFRGDVGRGNWIRDRSGTAVANGWTAFQRLQEWRARQPQGRTNRELLDSFSRPGAPGARRAKALAKATKAASPAPAPRTAPEAPAAPTPAKAASSTRTNEQLRQLFDSSKPTDNADKVDNLLAQRGTGSGHEGRSVGLFRRGADGQNVQVGRISTRDVGDNELRVSSLSAGPVGRIRRTQDRNWVAVDNDGRITGIATNPETAVDALVNGAERANARPGASFRAVKKAAKAAEASAALAKALRRGETAPANQVRQQLLDAPDLDARRKVLTDLEMNNTQARKLARDLGVSRLGRGQADEIVEGLADTFEANVRDRDRDLTPTSPVKKAAKATKATASQIDESAPLARDPEGDGMYMHGDSASMNLAQALARKGRNGSANRIMDLRRRTSLQDDNGQYAPVSEMLDEMRRMRDAETDPDLIRQIDDSIERIDGPDTPVPDLPDNTPPLARKLIEDLNEIPYARKRKGDRTSAGSFQYEKSIVEQAADAIRDAAIGRRDDTRRSPADRLRNILRDRVHESNDGSLQIWKLAERLDDGKLSDPDSLPGSLRALERGAQTPAPPVGAPAPPDPSVDLSPGDGLPVTTRLAAERALGNAPGSRNTLNRLDGAVRMPDTRHQVPALVRQVDQELQKSGVTPDEKPRRELREWFARHFPDGEANRAARVEGAMAPRKTAAPEVAGAPRNNYIGQTISGSQVESLRPGDVVEFPRTPREAARRATVANVANGTATMEDGSRVSAHTGRKVRVIEQQGLEAPPTAPAKRATKATRAAERAAKKVAPEAEAPAATEVTPETATSASRVRPRDIAVGDLIPATSFLPPSRAPRFEDGNAVWDLPRAPGEPRTPRAFPLKRVARIDRPTNGRYQFLDEDGNVIDSVNPNSHVWRASGGPGAPVAKKAAAPAVKKAAPEAVPEAPETPPAKKAAEPVKAATAADLKARPDPTPEQSDEDIRDQAEAEFNRLQGLRGLQGEDVSNQAMLQNRERLRLRGARNRIEAARPRPEGVADRMAWRQANIDAKRPVANSLSELNELVDNEASTEALRSRLRSGGYELHPKVLKQLQDAVDTGDRDKITAAIDRVAGDHGLTRTTGPAGSIEPFDTDLHRRLDNKERLFPGTMVRVTRPGYRSEIDGDQVALTDNLVEAATTAEVTEARRLSPTQVDNRVRAAYRAALAKKTDGDNRWVGLAELRQELGDSLSREQIDASLRRLADGRNNRLIPEENQKTITSGDRDAAISLSGEPKHLISMTDASSSDAPEKDEAPKATSRWNVDPKPFGNFTPTNDRAWGREEQSRDTFFPKEPVARDADNIKVGEVVPIAGDNANWGVVTEAIVQGQRNSDVIRVREPGMTPRLVSKSLTKEKVRQNAAERAWREAGGLNPGESTADERAQRLAKTAEAPAKAATPPVEVAPAAKAAPRTLATGPVDQENFDRLRQEHAPDLATHIGARAIDQAREGITAGRSRQGIAQGLRAQSSQLRLLQRPSAANMRSKVAMDADSRKDLVRKDAAKLTALAQAILGQPEAGAASRAAQAVPKPQARDILRQAIRNKLLLPNERTLLMNQETSVLRELADEFRVPKGRTRSSLIDALTKLERATGVPSVEHAKLWAKENGYVGRTGGWIGRKGEKGDSKGIVQGWDEFAKRFAGRINDDLNVRRGFSPAPAKKAAPEAPPAKKVVPEAPVPLKALAPIKAAPTRGLPGDRPLSQDEMLTLADVSARGRFTRDGEGGWVRRSSVRSSFRENLDRLADEGWLDRRSSPDGDFFRISPTGRPAPQGDILEGQVLPRPLEAEHRLPLTNVNRGALIHGYRDPDNPSRFTNVPETDADPSRIARIVVQRVERVTEKGDTDAGIFEKTHARIVGHDADTGRRMDSGIESGGSYWNWEANPDTDTSPDIEGEVVPEAPVRKAVKAAKAAAPEAPAETDAGRRFLTREEIAPETEGAPDFTAREFPKLPAPTRQGLHQIRLPDGTMAERTSKTRNYTHAVVVEQDNRLSASNLRQQVEVGKRHQQDYEDAVRTGDWSKFRKVTASHSANDELTGRVGTDYVRKDDTRKYPERYANPDPNDWSNRKYSKEFDDRNNKTAAEVAARSIQSQREYRQRLWDRSMAEADALDAGPEKSYGVYRWSSSAANARSALNAADLPEGPDLKKRVVEVGSDMSGDGTGVRRAGISRGRVSAARQADEAAAAAKKAVPTAKEVGMDRSGRLSDMNAPSARAPEDGVDRFDGIARSGWLKEARRTKTAVSRGAPAHEIARLVGEKQARDSASTSWVLRYGGRGQNTDEDYNAVTGKMEKALSKDEFVERTVKRFNDDHNAKLRELGIDSATGAPTKKAAKKAAAATAPGVSTADADDLEGPRVLKQTLLDIAKAEGIDDVRPNWTKPRIRDAIRRARADRAIDMAPSRIDAPGASKAAPVKALRKAAAPTEAPSGVKSIDDIRVPIGERPEGYDVILDARQGSFDGPGAERRLVSRLDVERTPALRNVAKLLGLNPKSSDRRTDLQRMVRDEIARQRGIDLTPESPARRELEKLGREELLKRLDAKGLKAPLRAKNNRLIDLLADDEPRGKYHLKEDAPTKNLRRMAESPDTRDERHFGSGLDAEVTLVRNGDKEAIRKRYVPDGLTDAKARADSETLGSQVAKAIEADAPAVFRPSERTIFMDRVPGKPGGRFNDAEQLEVAQTPGGKRIALLDALTGHSDRHEDNWIKKPDGSPAAIDNGIMFKSSRRDGDDFLPVPSHSHDAFNNHYGTIINGPSDQFNLPKDATWGKIPWSKQELESIRPKLQALRPDFELVGRGDWHDHMMGRLDTMIRKADDGPELPQAPRAAKKAAKAAAPAPPATPDVPGTASSPQRRVRKAAAPVAPEPVEEAEDFPQEDLVQRFLEDVDAGTITRAGEVRHGLLHFKGKQLRDLHKQLGGDGSGPIGDVRNDVASRVRKKLGIPTRADDRKREELDALSRDELKAMVPEDERRGSSAMGREDLINTIIGDGTRGDFHGTPDADVQQLKADLGAKPKVTRNFGQGSMGTVSQVEGRNGRPAVRKRLATGWILPAEHQADAENLYSRVGRAMGIDTPSVYQPTSRTVYMDYIDDMTLARNATPEQIAQAVQSDMGRRILLSDVLTAQEDRMEFNWGIRSNGEPVVFDNAMSFRHDSMPDPNNDDDVLPSLRIPDAFNEHYGVVVGGYEGQDPSALRWGNIPWTKSELRKVQRQIKPLKADFEKLGRGDWYDQMDQRLKTLIRKAPDTLPGARPVGAPTTPAPGRAARGMARAMGVPSVPTAAGPKKIGSAPSQPSAPKTGPSVGRAKVPGRVGQSADLRRPSDRRPVTGTVDSDKMNLPNDTGPLGRPVQDLDVRTAHGTYRIASGTAWRENGFTLTVEHPDTPEGALRAAEARKRVMDYVQRMPAQLRPFLKSVMVADNASPDEKYWRDRWSVDRPEMASFQVKAQAINGNISVWRRDWTMSDTTRPFDAVLDHEMGHLIDQRIRELMSEGQAWRDAVADDDNRIDRHLGPGPASHSRDRRRNRRRRPNIPGGGDGFDGGGGGFPDGFSPFHGLLDFDFPSLRKRKGRRKGVTPYGAVNSHEDFAESAMLYLRGPIGLGTFNGRMTQEPIWFSDLFPGRTAVLDQVFPSIAAQRNRQIRQIRQLPIHQRATAIRNAAGPMGAPLVQNYQSPPRQQPQAPRNLAPDVSTGVLRGGRVAPSRSEILGRVRSGTPDEARRYLDELRVEFELLPLARALGIRGTGSMRKAELIEAIISATARNR